MKMEKINGWNEVEAVQSGVSEKLVAGAYECEILNAQEMTSKTGKQMLVFYFDISDGKYAGYFKRQYDRRVQYANGKEVYWGCRYYQLIEGDSLGRFKGLIMNIEASNKGYKWDWKEDKLAGKKIGVVFREEEFAGSNGKIMTTVRPYYCVALDKIADEPVPEALRLQQNSNSVSTFADDDIPF